MSRMWRIHTKVSFRGRPFLIGALLLILVLVLAPGFISWTADQHHRARQRARLRDAAAAAQREYAALHAVIHRNNQEYGMDSWTMNGEHLFAGHGDLRDRVIRFVRMPTALDLLYDRLLHPATSADEILVIAELLVYHGQYDVAGDDLHKSDKAHALRAAIDAGRFTGAERKYPQAPIMNQIRYSIDKSERILVN